MDRLGIVEAVEDSKNDETFEDAAPVTPGTLAELASATLEMVETQGMHAHSPRVIEVDQFQGGALRKSGSLHDQQTPQTTQPPQSQQPPQQPQSQQPQGQQPQQQVLPQQPQGNMDLIMLEASMENLPESMDLER